MSCPYRGTMVLPSPRKSYRGSSSMLTRVRASLSMRGSSSSSGDAGVREHSSYARGKRWIASISKRRYGMNILHLSLMGCNESKDAKNVVRCVVTSAEVVDGGSESGSVNDEAQLDSAEANEKPAVKLAPRPQLRRPTFSAPKRVESPPPNKEGRNGKNRSQYRTSENGNRNGHGNGYDRSNNDRRRGQRHEMGNGANGTRPSNYAKSIGTNNNSTSKPPSRTYDKDVNNRERGKYQSDRSRKSNTEFRSPGAESTNGNVNQRSSQRERGVGIGQGQTERAVKGTQVGGRSSENGLRQPSQSAKPPRKNAKSKAFDASVDRDNERDDNFRARRKKKAMSAVVTPEMKRKSREERKKRRALISSAKASEAMKEQVDILEVGPDGMPIEELARLLVISPTQVVGSLFMKGIMTTVNQTIDAKTVSIVCEEFDVDVVELSEEEAKEAAEAREAAEASDDTDIDSEGLILEKRAPVVCIMGHVDHGKTSLLDFMKQSTIASGEAGGITQGIGAYRIPVKTDSDSKSSSEEQVVFLDTPGHEAFSEMRRRGAKMTDVALLVVAADDGVQETTRQALKFAKTSQVPIIVALTKADKADSQPDRVRQELADIGLLCEDWGGDVPTIPISSKSGMNIDTLLETILLVAEMEDLKANPHRPARGTVIDAEINKGKGSVATIMVQEGTLCKGDWLRAGPAFGRVRAIHDDRGHELESAGPSMPVQVTGLSIIPSAGDPVSACESMREAETLSKTSPVIETMVGDLNWAADSNAQMVNLLIRADNAGSLEAVKASLAQIPQKKVALKFVQTGPGEISAGDVELAATSGSIVVGFNVSVAVAAAARAKQADVTISSFDVIYSLIDYVKEQMLMLVEETEELNYVGKATVKAIFPSGRGTKVAGCLVTDGEIHTGNVVTVSRKVEKKQVEILSRDSINSIRKVKEVVSSITEGNECGIRLEKFSDYQAGDTISVFEAITLPPTLD